MPGSLGTSSSSCRPVIFFIFFLNSNLSGQDYSILRTHQLSYRDSLNLLSLGLDINKIEENINFMVAEPTKNKNLKRYYSERFKTLKNCKISKASNEIMLDRFYNGESIEFPFSSKL